MSQQRSAPPTPLHPALGVAIVAAGTGAMLLGGGVAAGLHWSLRAQVALGTLALALPALLALALVPNARRAALGAPLPPRAVGLSATLGAALWVGSVGLMEVQSLVKPPPPEYLALFRRLHEALAPRDPLDALVSLIVIAALPAVCEELVVRGVLLPSLARPLGPAAAVAASALLFALMHMDPYRFLFTFVLGLVFGGLRLRTGSLWPPVLGHLTLNALTFLVAPYVDDGAAAYTPQPALGLACLAAGSALALPLLRALARDVESPPA